MSSATGAEVLIMKTLILIAAVSAALMALAGIVLPAGAGAAEESLTIALDLPPTKSTPVPWGRDPFVPLLAEVTAPDMALKAIFYHASRPSAIINADIVYEGSTVNGQKVIDIGRTHVILQSVSGRIRLELASLPELTDGDEKSR
jgi:hypothetical protein